MDSVGKFDVNELSYWANDDIRTFQVTFQIDRESASRARGLPESDRYHDASAPRTPNAPGGVRGSHQAEGPVLRISGCGSLAP